LTNPLRSIMRIMQKSDAMKIKKPGRRDIIIFIVTLIVFAAITTFWDALKDIIAGIFN
jgi:hypothetical protein